VEQVFAHAKNLRRGAGRRRTIWHRGALQRSFTHDAHRYPLPMSAPLARLRRRAHTVLLLDAFHMGLSRAHIGGTPFRRTEDAESYLRFWSADASAMGDLRRALMRQQPGTSLDSLSGEQVITKLARLLASGAVIAVETRVDIPHGAGESTVTSTAAAKVVADTVAAASSTAAAPAAVAELPAALPLLEEAQIEGAEVMPEVLQTLDQIAAAMATIDLATASLTPAPSGVSSIGGAVTAAGGGVTSTLDAL
jgi:hypothetical protein